MHDRLRGVPGLHAGVMDAARQLAPLQGRGGFRLGATVTSPPSISIRQRIPCVTQGQRLFRRLQVVARPRQYLRPLARDFDPRVYDRCLEILREPPPGKARVGGSRVRDTSPAWSRRLSARLPRRTRPHGLPRRPHHAHPRPLRRDHALRDAAATASRRSKDAGLKMGTGQPARRDYDIKRIMAAKARRKSAAGSGRAAAACTFECALYNGLVFNPASGAGAPRTGPWPLSRSAARLTRRSPPADTDQDRP